MTSRRSCLDWALRYARFGWRVHPVHWIKDGWCSCGNPRCKSAGKHPMLQGWPERATTKLMLIERWFTRTPDANIGVATGPESGLLVLDVDGPEGERSLVSLERRHGPLPEIFPQQWTGGRRAGWQGFLAYPEGRTIGNSGGRLGPKLDTRGDRGYCLVPPSVTGEAYRWAPDRSPWDIQPERAPSCLIELLDPSAPPPRPTWDGRRRLVLDDRYLSRAIESELALVASAPEGRRNDQLNESSFRLFRFAAEGRLAAGAIADSLHAAAAHAGLDQREIVATIRSAATTRGVHLP